MTGADSTTFMSTSGEPGAYDSTGPGWFVRIHFPASCGGRPSSPWSNPKTNGSKLWPAEPLLDLGGLRTRINPPLIWSARCWAEWSLHERTTLLASQTARQLSPTESPVLEPKRALESF